MHRIGVISDTHGLLRPEAAEILKSCEAIFHGGDFDTEDIMDALLQIAPVYAVCGNNDYWADAEADDLAFRAKSRYLTETLAIELYGVSFFMVHDKKRIPNDITAYDVIIYGHSHKYEETYSGRQLILNPGSCGPRRFTLPVTLALLDIEENGTFQVKRVDLAKKGKSRVGAKAGKKTGRKGKRSSDMKQAIELVVKDIEKGASVNKIADRHGISRELAEQICRLYLTHPGVDADGIMRKMGL